MCDFWPVFKMKLDNPLDKIVERERQQKKRLPPELAQLMAGPPVGTCRFPP